MALQILNQNEIFHLNGKLNATTLNFFTTYFDYNLSLKNKITLNIDSVTSIDKNCLEAMRTFTEKATLQKKSFTIVGYGCKEIYDHFNQTNVA